MCHIGKCIGMDIRYIINAIAAEEENVAYRFFWGVGGGIFNPKIYIADFGTFKQGILSKKLIQKSNFTSGFRVCFFQQLYLEKSKQDTL